MSLLLTAVIALADDPPTDIDPATGKGAEWGKAAPVGLLVILLMGIAVFFLLRSMTRNMRKVPKSFDPAVAPADVEPAEVPAAEPTVDDPADAPDVDQHSPLDLAEPDRADRR